MNRSKPHSGFSAFEMLISLLLIGIVMAITLPKFVSENVSTLSVHGNKSGIQSIQYSTEWKSIFQTINQANGMVLVSNGGNIANLCSDNKCLKDLYMQHLNVMSSCDNQVGGTCWHKSGKWKHLNGVPIGEFDSAAGLTLLRGELLAFMDANSACPGGVCGRIYVDVNGFKEPNAIGIDIFLINILDKSITPYGAGMNVSDCAPNSAGFTCSYKYLYN